MVYIDMEISQKCGAIVRAKTVLYSYGKPVFMLLLLSKNYHCNEKRTFIAQLSHHMENLPQ